jgi:hypothetical protein
VGGQCVGVLCSRCSVGGQCVGVLCSRFSLQRMYLHLWLFNCRWMELFGDGFTIKSSLQSRCGICVCIYAYLFLVCNLFIMGVLCGVGFLLCFNNFLLFIFFLYTYP